MEGAGHLWHRDHSVLHLDTDAYRGGTAADSCRAMDESVVIPMPWLPCATAAERIRTGVLLPRGGQRAPMRASGASAWFPPLVHSAPPRLPFDEVIQPLQLGLPVAVKVNDQSLLRPWVMINSQNRHASKAQKTIFTVTGVMRRAEGPDTVQAV